MHPKEERLTRLGAEPGDGPVYGLPRAPLGIVAHSSFARIGLRHFVVIESEPLVEPELLLEHGRPHKRCRVPALPAQNLRQR